mmetsp:Transcript_13588/g.34594  ORF Transcript_13588/g.34594 Transcript_13588/m.34594 type:complete len:269 (-) Transcript_13588:327-1133(-)
MNLIIGLSTPKSAATLSILQQSVQKTTHDSYCASQHRARRYWILKDHIARCDHKRRLQIPRHRQRHPRRHLQRPKHRQIQPKRRKTRHRNRIQRALHLLVPRHQPGPLKKQRQRHRINQRHRRHQGLHRERVQRGLQRALAKVVLQGLRDGGAEGGGEAADVEGELFEGRDGDAAGYGDEGAGFRGGVAMPEHGEAKKGGEAWHRCLDDLVEAHGDVDKADVPQNDSEHRERGQGEDIFCVAKEEGIFAGLTVLVVRAFILNDDFFPL